MSSNCPRATRTVSLVVAGLFALTLLGCGVSTVDDRTATAPPTDVVVQTNILILIADDFGIESSVCYDDDPAPAPRLEAFCDEAVVFDNVWASPICSPTRAGILTGRHSFRTGITEQLTGDNGLEIDPAELTLPRVLDEAQSGYVTANFGKWHLGGDAGNPNTMGWDHFSGVISGGLSDYERWNKTTNGVTETTTTYATTANVDDALAWIGQQDAPWLTWIGFNAPHTPFHNPPAELHTQDLSNPSESDQYRAAVEALDTEIGRLIDSLDPATRENTTIIFVGDNGTPGQVSSYDQGEAKGSLGEGGVSVPMMVWGAGVEGGRRSDALVGSIDIFATAIDLAGVDLEALGTRAQIDSRSFRRVLDGSGDGDTEFLLTSIWGDATRDRQEGTAIRNEQWKLIEFSTGRSALFDLATDPLAQNPLRNPSGEAASAQSLLSSTLAAWTESPSAPSPNK